MMHKKYFLLSIIAIAIIILINVILFHILYCGDEGIERDMASDIQIVILEDTLDNRGCIYEVRNGTPPMKDCTENKLTRYTIDVFKNKKWSELETLPGVTLLDPDYMSGTEDQYLPLSIELKFWPTRVKEFTNRNVDEVLANLDNPERGYFDEINWESLYGELEPGTYRLVKWIGHGNERKYIYAPFTIK